MNAFIESPILRTNYYYDILITNIDKIEGKDRYQFDFQVSHKELVSSILKKDLKVFYGFKRSKNISLLKFDLHSPCVIYNDERKEWCRAEVLQKISDSLVAVKLVDYGGIKCVHHSYLKICDKRFLTPCLLGYSASAMTLEERFNTPATMFYEFKEEFLNKKLKCKIINYDKHSNQYVLCFDRDYYSHDPNNNTNACVERNIIKKPCWENFRKIEHLNELSIHYGKPYRITVTYVVSPNQFYVQLLENLDQLNNKSVDLQEVSEDAPILEDIEVNKACVAKWFYDNLWYRAQVVQCDFKRQQAVVRFIDFGITQTCSFTNLRQLSDVFDENKCAILVNLKNVKNQEWSEKEMNDFEELACYKQAEFDGYFEEKDKRIEWIGSFIEEKNIEINVLVERCVKRKIFQLDQPYERNVEYETFNLILSKLKKKTDEIRNKMNKQIEMVKMLTEDSFDIRIRLLNELRTWKVDFEDTLTEVDALIENNQIISSQVINKSKELFNHWFKTEIENMNEYCEQIQFLKSKADINLMFNMSGQLIDLNFNIDIKRIEHFKMIYGGVYYDQRPDDEFKRRFTSRIHQINFLKSDHIHKDLLLLRDGSIVLLNENQVIVYDENIENPKLLVNADCLNVRPHCITYDSQHQNMYMAGYDCIIKANMKFDITARFNFKKDESFISSIYFQHNTVFACDFKRRRILLLTADKLEYIHSLELYYKPVQIIVNYSTICIRSGDFNSVHFYDLKTFRLKSRYYGHCGFISIIDSFFCEFDVLNAKFYFYNSEGVKDDEEIENGFFKIIQNDAKTIAEKCLINGKIINLQDSLLILLRQKNDKTLLLRLFDA